MQCGGVILIHDYFNSGFPGVKKAVDEFCQKHNIFAIPIGDDISIAVCKTMSLMICIILQNVP